MGIKLLPNAHHFLLARERGCSMLVHRGRGSCGSRVHHRLTACHGTEMRRSGGMTRLLLVLRLLLLLLPPSGGGGVNRRRGLRGGPAAALTEHVLRRHHLLQLLLLLRRVRLHRVCTTAEGGAGRRDFLVCGDDEMSILGSFSCRGAKLVLFGGSLGWRAPEESKPNSRVLEKE